MKKQSISTEARPQAADLELARVHPHTQQARQARSLYARRASAAMEAASEALRAQFSALNCGNPLRQVRGSVTAVRDTLTLWLAAGSVVTELTVEVVEVDYTCDKEVDALVGQLAQFEHLERLTLELTSRNDWCDMQLELGGMLSALPQLRRLRIDSIGSLVYVCVGAGHALLEELWLDKAPIYGAKLNVFPRLQALSLIGPAAIPDDFKGKGDGWSEFVGLGALRLVNTMDGEAEEVEQMLAAASLGHVRVIGLEPYPEVRGVWVMDQVAIGAFLEEASAPSAECEMEI